MHRRHGYFFFPYSTTVASVSAFFSSVTLSASVPHLISPVWVTCLPCSRCTSTRTVYVPCGSGSPLLSLPSQTTSYLPGPRVARVTDRTRAESFPATFHQSVRVRRYFGLLPQTEMVRTVLPLASSSHTATYGRRTRKPLIIGSSTPIVTW